MIALVAYATEHGSTREVADAIGERLRERGFGVDVMDARATPADLSGYDLVVLGGALYIGRWHHDAVAFLKQHRTELASKPLAVFWIGPAKNAKPAFDAARVQLDHSLARAAVTPELTAVFGGVVQPKRLRFPFELDARLRRPRLGGDRELRQPGRGPRGIARVHRRHLTRLAATGVGVQRIPEAARRLVRDRPRPLQLAATPDGQFQLSVTTTRRSGGSYH